AAGSATTGRSTPDQPRTTAPAESPERNPTDGEEHQHRDRRPGPSQVRPRPPGDPRGHLPHRGVEEDPDRPARGPDADRSAAPDQPARRRRARPPAGA